MIKLYVDDIRPAPDSSWMVARTVSSAIAAIAQFGEQMEVISLDHDISHQVSIGNGLERPFPCNETFTPVAWFMKHYYMTLPKKPAQIIIHTSNPEGAQKMKSILQRVFSDSKLQVRPMGAANRL